MSLSEQAAVSQSQELSRQYARRWWALGAITLSILLIGLDTYVLATALPTLSVKLGASTSQLQWINATYTLAWPGLLLPAGKLGDLIGRRKVLLVGLVIFGAASLIASRVNTPTELIWVRVAMGAGGALILTLALALIPVLFPDSRERNKATTIAAVGTMLGMPLGPILGGWMLTHFSWGSVFLINCPVALLSLIGVLLWVPESKSENRSRLDWPGAVLVVIGTTGAVFGVIELPTYGWSDPRVLASLIGGVVILAAFVMWQRRISSPLVDLRLFKNAPFLWGTITFSMVSFAMCGVLFVLTPYLELVQGADPQLTGLRVLPMIVAMLIGAAASEQFVARTSPKIVIITGLVISAAGLAVLAGVSAGTGYGIIGLALAVFGVGLGFSIPQSVDCVLGSLSREQAGAGNGLSRTLQNVAVSFSVAIIGSVLSSGYRNSLGGTLRSLSGAAKNLAQGSVAGAHSIAASQAGAPAHQLVTAANSAYVHGMGEAVWVSAGVLAGTAVLSVIFFPGWFKPHKDGSLLG
jgi:DHA2 family multidrug resistance protein-like MFS transporter